MLDWTLNISKRLRFLSVLLLFDERSLLVKHRVIGGKARESLLPTIEVLGAVAPAEWVLKSLLLAMGLILVAS